MPLLREASDNMLPRGGCVACHAQPTEDRVMQLLGLKWAAADADVAVPAGFKLKT